MKHISTLEAALAYAARGWHVFPVEPPRPGDRNSGKNPLTQRGKDDATTDSEIINSWWTRWPDASVAIACEPSKLVVLDVDVGEKIDGSIKGGYASLAEFDDLPPTLTAITGSGGYHVIYTTDSPALQRIGFRDGLDLIGKGYIVAAPSTHWTGGTYRWHDTREPVTLPEILKGAAIKALPAIAPTLREPITEGGRNNALFRVGAALREQGIGREALEAALQIENAQRCNPPVHDSEIRAIVGSIMQRVNARDIAANAVVASEIRSIVAPLTKAVWIGEATRRTEPPMRMYGTGFPELDTLLGGGVATRQICGIIGPPSSGKSAAVGSIAWHLQKTVPVLHTSTELPTHELGVRYAAVETGFPWRDGMKGLVPQENIINATKGMRIKLLGCDDLDRADPLGHIQREAEAIKEQCGEAPVIIVDYVQMLARSSEDKIRSKVGELTMGLRIMSQTLDCAIIAVFATRRDFYGGGKMEALREADDPSAYLAAAKESGDIEFDCATLLFLDVNKNHDGQPKPARIAVARCRVGDIGFAGARAQLDVGRWIPDPSAKGDMATKKQSTSANTDAVDDAKLLDAIRKLPNCSWRDLRTASGLRSVKAEETRSRLLLQGVIEQITDKFCDRLGREQKRTILRLTQPPTVKSDPG